MRPYGSKRSFDTEPRIKNARALVKREGEAAIEEQIESSRRTKFPRLCKACQDEEIRRAFECLDRERAAEAKGEPFECTCPPLECGHL